ncbi:MAG: hypothetical protein NT069_12185, partial [Planctomycetota bacterium]|nr:hypothetical protein [Planctomycetota bacterium]
RLFAAFQRLADRNWSKPRYEDAPVDSGMQTPRGENVRALVLISPQQNIQGFGMAAPMKFLGAPIRNIAFLVCVAERDSHDKGQAKKTFDQVSSYPKSDERMYFKEYPGNARGTDLLGKRKLEDNISTFLSKHLKEPQIPWTDRRPADDRK